MKHGFGGVAGLLVLVVACGNGGAVAPVTPADEPPPPAEPAAPVPAEPEAAPAKPARESLEEWLTRKLPEGGRLEADGQGGFRVWHARKPGESLWTVARNYLELTDYYRPKDLVVILEHRAKGKAKGELEIPRIVKQAFADDPTLDRLAEPEGGARGTFVTGACAALRWVELIDKTKAHGMNAVVLDSKDYEGMVNYPSDVKIAIESKASRAPTIPDLTRAIRLAHQRGLYVILRIPAFHDPLTSNRVPRLSIQGNWGKPFPMGWLNPENEEAQQYIVDLAEEGIRKGADEIQLDYVRYPVHRGAERALLAEPKDGNRIRIIADFVRKVHKVTSAHGVKLSLDIFGLTAIGSLQRDLETLGQDIETLAMEAEVLSPMVYPSHYTPGFWGYKQPGNQPEIVGIATKAAVAKLPSNSKAVIRQWLQAFPDRSPSFGAEYVKTEVKLAEQHGSKGWLLWSPGCHYWAAWQAWPAKG